MVNNTYYLLQLITLSMTTPQKLAIYYGWPSAVNGVSTIADAITEFQAYDIVVFGAGLEDPAHADHTNTVNIIAGLTSTEVYGYIDSEATNTINWGNIDAWASMGVAGIFCDKFGYDYNVDRNRQNVLVEYIHYKGLKAFVNAWDPDDVFLNTVDATKNPLGTAHMMGSNDWYLAESYQIINGAYQTGSDWKVKSDKMVSYRTSFGTKMATVTTNDSSAFDQTKWDYSYCSAVLYQMDASGWGEENFSSVSASLPFHTRYSIVGTSFITAITENPSDVFSRQTNVGIKVDTVNHSVDTLL